MSSAAESDYEVLISQWTPKIHRMIRNVQIQGYTTEDLVQELTIEILRAAEYFDESQGVTFHTLLHKFMATRIHNLRSWSIRKFGETDFDTEHFTNQTENTTKFGADANMTQWALLDEVELTAGERVVIELLLMGYKRSEIERFSPNTRPKTWRAIFTSLKDKFEFLKEEEE